MNIDSNKEEIARLEKVFSKIRSHSNSPNGFDTLYDLLREEIGNYPYDPRSTYSNDLRRLEKNQAREYMNARDKRKTPPMDEFRNFINSFEYYVIDQKNRLNERG